MNTSANAWGVLLRLLDLRQPIPKQTKSGGAIEFWREWDAGRQKAVWGKRYIANDAYDLQAFNSAEIEWLMQLASADIGNTYRRASLEQEGTKLSEPASTTIKTFDCGPTLDDWLRTTVSLGGRSQAHCFVQPEAFLRMAQGVLLALERVHACHFVHCDVHPGNITLPMSLLDASVDKLRMLPRWDEITLIDFGYSIDSRRPPKTTLPIRHTGEGVRISPHLKSILIEVEAEAEKLLGPGDHWANVCLNPAWWHRLADSPLNAFTRLDWREDLYQLGFMLADVRDGVGVAAHLGGRTLRESLRVAAVNQMVNELPEQLMQLGLSQEKPMQRPHLNFVESIQRVLFESQSVGHGCPREFELRKTDFDSTAIVSPAPVSIPNPRALVKPPMPRAAETAMGLPISKQPGPPWARYVADLPLPVMRPLRVAAPAGWQFVAASTPVTWRQWRGACQHNPSLFRPGALAQSDDLPEQVVDAAITHVSHADCLAYIDTINHLTGSHAMDGLARFRLPTAAEWSLLAAGGGDEAVPGLDAGIQKMPVAALAPNAHGLAGIRNYLWQWVAAPEGAAWAQVRGGCAEQPRMTEPATSDPMDYYPADYRSPFITFRLVRHVPLIGAP